MGWDRIRGKGTESKKNEEKGKEGKGNFLRKNNKCLLLNCLRNWS